MHAETLICIFCFHNAQAKIASTKHNLKT